MRKPSGERGREVERHLSVRASISKKMAFNLTSSHDTEWDREVLIPSYMMTEGSSVRLGLDSLVLLATAYSAVVTPYNAAFGSTSYGIWKFMAGLRSFIFLLDVGSHFVTTYADRNHETVVDRSKIAWRYMKSTCIIDFVSSFPWGLFSKQLAFLELLRCFTAPYIMGRMLDSGRILDSVQRLACWGMFQLLCFLLLYLHWIACLWYVVSKDGWFATHANVNLGLEDVDPYYVSLEASLHLTVGASGLPDCVPTSTAEAKVQTLILVMGACIVSGIFGGMASLLAGVCCSVCVCCGCA
jgi:hypothetical protein